MNYTHIFWDWNGTLLDDRDYCIATVNRSLSARNMDLLDKDKYYRLFRFPIIDYYVDLGFDFTKESYADLAVEYNVNYAEHNAELKLRKDAREVLAVFRSKGLTQYVLSASERKVLTDAIDGYGIAKYFDAVVCTDNYLAEGKVEYGKRFASTIPSPHSFLLIGDTPHDLETAQAIGADCVLIKDGHTSDEKLASCGVKVIDCLHDLYPIVFGNEKQSAKNFSLPNLGDLEKRSFDINEAEPKNFRTKYKDFYDDLKNTNKTEDW